MSDDHWYKKIEGVVCQRCGCDEPLIDASYGTNNYWLCRACYWN